MFTDALTNPSETVTIGVSLGRVLVLMNLQELTLVILTGRLVEAKMKLTRVLLL